jgi:hypothetical protein
MTGPEAPQCEDSINNNGSDILLTIHKKEETMDVYMKEGYRSTDPKRIFPVHDYYVFYQNNPCACKE